MQSALEEIGPGAEEKGQNDSRDDEDVGKGVHGIFGEAFLNQFVVVERVEEVQALERKQEKDAGPEVATVGSQENFIQADDLTERNLINLLLTL